MKNRLSDSAVERCAAAWSEAGRELEVRVTAPMEVKDGSTRFIFAAYLPDFGSPSGCYLYPVISLIENKEWRVVHAWAQKHHRYVSFIDVDGYSTYDRAVFIEALSDWAYFGDAALRPVWLKKSE